MHLNDFRITDQQTIQVVSKYTKYKLKNLKMAKQELKIWKGGK